MYNTESIRNLIACGESSTIQFKREFSNQKKLAAEMIAFANSHGGMILFGVEDKSGVITGLSFDEIKTLNIELANTANEQVRPTLYIQTDILPIDGKNILIASIEEGAAKPYKDLNGNIWVKQGSDKRRITENSEILRLFASSRIYNPDEDIVPNTSINDLNDRAIDEYLLNTYHQQRSDFGIPFPKLLQNLRIADSMGRLTLAGLLYFGKSPQKFKPAFCIKAISFYGNDPAGNNYRDSKDMEGTIPELFDQAMRFLDMNLYHRQEGRSFNTLGKLEISKISLEEMLQNSLVHREYIKQAPIRLFIFDDRVEIISPGCLADGLSVDEIKLGNTTQRNPLIGTFCTRTMVYRGVGTGILRSLREGTKIEFENDEAGNQFKVTMYRNSLSDGIGEGGTETDNGSTETSKNGNSGGTETDNGGTETTQMKILNIIKHNPSVKIRELSNLLNLSKNAIQKNLDILKKNGMISRVGAQKNGHWQIKK